MNLEDLVDFEKGEMVLVNWEDVLVHPKIDVHARAETCSSKSIGWFDEVYYGKVATLVIVTEVQEGMHVDKQAFPIGCISNIQRLRTSSDEA